MKFKRSWLLWITFGLAFLLIAYTFLRSFGIIKLDKETELYVINGVIIAAIAIFFINRKMVADEQKEDAERKNRGDKGED